MVKKSILAKVGDKINYKLIRDGYKTGKGNVVVTAEMDTKTTIVADVPSTAYTSNLDYEVDISGENPPIINIKNDITCPDDTVISKGKYLFYDIGQEYDVKNTNWKPEFAEPNGYTIVGSPTISSEFIMTNFNESNYISTPNLDYSSPFILEMHLKLSSYPSGWVFKSSVDYSLDTYFGNSMIIAIGNGSNYHDMAITPSLPFDGKMILKWDGNIYTYIAIDEVSDTTYGPVTYSSSSVIPSSPMKIGYKNCDYIDLKKFIFTSSDSSKSYRAIKDESIINIPGIKDFKLNDDGTELTTKLFDYHYREEVSSQDKASLYINSEKDNNLYYEKDDFDINIIGSGVSITNDGVANGFNGTNYLTKNLTINPTSKFEIVCKFTTGNSVSNQYVIVDAGHHNSNFIRLQIYQSHFQVGVVSNGSWVFNTAAQSVSTNTTYYGKFVFNGTNYEAYLSTDGVNWGDPITYNYSALPGKISSVRLGLACDGDVPFNGSIDILNSYVKIDDGENQYFAETIKKRYDIPSLYSEFVDNITIPAHVLYEYVNGEWKLSGDSPVITQDVTVNADNAEIAMKEIEE